MEQELGLARQRMEVLEQQISPCISLHLPASPNISLYLQVLEQQVDGKEAEKKRLKGELLAQLDDAYPTPTPLPLALALPLALTLPLTLGELLAQLDDAETQLQEAREVQGEIWGDMGRCMEM